MALVLIEMLLVRQSFIAFLQKRKTQPDNRIMADALRMALVLNEMQFVR
jgi:hypothetical protein